MVNASFISTYVITRAQES